MATKRILMTMVEVGAGHKAPAYAVKQALEDRYPGTYTVDVVDLAKQAGASKNDDQLKTMWSIGLRFPILARILDLGIGVLHPFSLVYPRVFLREFMKKSALYLNSYMPDLVFSTYTFCSTAAVMARRKSGAAYKIVTYVVDPFDGYSWWAEKDVDQFFVASEESSVLLQKHGIDKAKIRITHFPIHKSFLSIGKTKEEIAQAYPLHPGKRIMLATEGGFGIGNVWKFVKALFEASLPYNVLFVCGRNEKRYLELKEYVAGHSSETNLIPLSYVGNMNELHCLADFVIGKAGASTLFESLLQNNPIIFTDWATYNDKKLIDFALHHNVGWYVKNDRDLFRVLTDIEKTTALEDYKKNIAHLRLTSGAEEIADLLHELLQSGDIDLRI